MTPLNEEILTDYIFELLDEQTAKSVENTLTQCPESRRKLQILKNRFNQLELADQKKPQVRGFLKSLTLAAAAIITFSFLMGLPAPLFTDSQSSVPNPAPQKKVEQRISSSFFKLEVYSELIEGYSLMAKLEAPLKNSLDLEVPEVKIHYDEDNYEIVDLNRYISLTLPSGFSDPESSEIYTNLNLTNHTH